MVESIECLEDKAKSCQKNLQHRKGVYHGVLRDRLEESTISEAQFKNMDGLVENAARDKEKTVGELKERVMSVEGQKKLVVETADLEKVRMLDTIAKLEEKKRGSTKPKPQTIWGHCDCTKR
mmetsp:Transcript_18029/g.24343  ORF Transcript_18029/g.24343 Transcript_18029/m.24343 type:complete len:122 (-) Transcript_18029:204-569(-)